MINSETVLLSLNKFEAALVIKALKFTRNSTKIHTDYVTGQVLKELTQRMEALVRDEKTDHSRDDELFEDG